VNHPWESQYHQYQDAKEEPLFSSLFSVHKGKHGTEQTSISNQK
jgi:hypothetical protein